MLRSIQLLRGIAATAVVFHHAYKPGHDLSAARYGAAGVDVFFVISGFIMATVAGSRSWDEFLGDRVFRIYPLWFVAVLPWFFIHPNTIGGTLTSLTLWPVWGHVAFPALAIGWTLSYEMLFYVVFAVGIAAGRPVVPFVIFGVLIVLDLLLRNVLVLRFIGSPMAMEFLAGVLIAKLPKRSRLGPVSIVAGLLAFAFSPYGQFMYGPETLTRVLQWGVPAALIVYGALSLEPLLDATAFAFPLFIGDASYSIYLFHPLIVYRTPWPAGVVGGLIIGVLAHLMIEKPIVRRVRDFKRARTARLEVVSAVGGGIIACPASARASCGKKGIKPTNGKTAE